MQTSLKKNAAILTLLMLVKKLLSIAYKIPYQNLTGDAGFYVFQQIYPIIAILMLLTGFALPTVIGSVLNQNHYSNAIKDKIKRSLWLFSLAVFAMLFLGNRQIALLMGDVQLATAIRIVGIHFLFLPPIAYMRGVLQSRSRTMKKMAYSVVIEQLARVLSVLLVLVFIDVHNQSYYRIAELVFTFSLIVPVVAMMHLYVMKPIDDVQSFLPLKEKPQIFRKTLFLALGAGILVIYALIDSFLVFNVLIQTNSQADAMILRGVYERSLPLVQAGTFFVGSLVSLTMVQFEKSANEKQKRIAFSTGMFYILGLAIPTAVGMIIVMPYLNTVLFMDQVGNVALQIMMVQIVLYSIIVLLTASLTRQSKESFVLASLLIGVLAKLLATVPLVQNFGIEGASVSSVLSLLLVCLIMIFASISLLTAKLVAIFIGISLATFIMWFGLQRVVDHVVISHATDRIDYLYLLLINAGIGALIYVVAISILVLSFKVIGNRVLAHHRKKQERLKKAMRAKKRRQAEIERLEQLQRQPNGQMQNAPPVYQSSMQDHLQGRGFVSQEKPTHYQKPRQQYRYENTQKKDGITMRLDKFLKVSRIIKRRQTAKEVSDAGKISVNGKVAKSSTALHIGDEIALHYATRTLVVRVTEIKDSTKKEDADRMYEILREEPRV